MTKSDAEGEIPKVLGIVADLLRGGRHSRHTIATAADRSLTTADRWIEHIATAFPSMRRVKEGKTTWLVHEARREMPTKLATVGACVAASLASIFQGTQHERNVRDARDYLLKQRGDAYDDLDRKLVFLPRGGEYALPEAAGELDEILDALLKTRRLSFAYTHNDGTSERCLVDPLSLVVFDHQFYVLSRRADTTFYCYRFARMSDVEATSEVFTYPTKSEFEPRSVFGPVLGVHISGMGPVEDVEVELAGEWARYAKTHKWHHSQRVVPTASGATVRMQVRHCPELETWALSFGENATVIAPKALRDKIATRLGTAVANYAPAAAPRPAVAKARSERRPPARKASSR